MRVTESQLHSLAVNSLIRTRERLLDAQKKAMTGKEHINPSDDPTVAARARIMRSLLEETRSYQRNIEMGNLRLQRAEQALADSSSLLVRAKELALSMANGTMSDEQRELAAAEVSQLHSSMIDLMNTKSGDEFVFANTATTTPVVDTNGNWNYDPDVYQGVREVEIGPASRGDIGSSASHAFARRAADPSSLDALAVLRNLETQLRNDDQTGIRTAIDQIDQVHDQSVAERARVGMRMNRLDTAGKAAEQSEQLYISLESDLVDADAAEAFSELSLAQTTLQAAVSVSSRILGPSLLDTI